MLNLSGFQGGRNKSFKKGTSQESEKAVTRVAAFLLMG